MGIGPEVHVVGLDIPLGSLVYALKLWLKHSFLMDQIDLHMVIWSYCYQIISQRNGITPSHPVTKGSSERIPSSEMSRRVEQTREGRGKRSAEKIREE